MEGTAAGFSAWLLRQVAEDTEITKAVALETAQRSLQRAVKGTNDAGAVDRGQFKRSWVAARTLDGAELRNDAPYAGVIEYGRRPGKPGPPLTPILEWVERKLELPPGAAWVVAKTIRDRIHEKGTKPRFILRKVVAKMGDDYQQSAVRTLRRRHGNG